MKKLFRARALGTLAGLLILAGFSYRTQQHPPATNIYQVGAVLWYQTSGEARALYYQAYNIARCRLDQMLDTLSPTTKPAVVVDIDETIVDNSPHQVKLITTGDRFPSYWDEWVARAQARPLPGAVEFLSYAASRGVAVFYVSNRDQNALAATMENLKKDGFPQVEASRFLMKDKESGKESRRREISKDYEILLLCGDNLSDFTSLFDNKPAADRSLEVDSLKDEFGRRFIVLPNPMYGDWEGAAISRQRGLGDAELEALRVKALRGY